LLWFSSSSSSFFFLCLCQNTRLISVYTW
jgi:hypothetical protein